MQGHTVEVGDQSAVLANPEPRVDQLTEGSRMHKCVDC